MKCHDWCEDRRSRELEIVNFASLASSKSHPVTDEITYSLESFPLPVE